MSDFGEVVELGDSDFPQDVPFDISEVIAEAEEAEAQEALVEESDDDAPDEDEVGPEESGELAEEDDAAAEDEINEEQEEEDEEDDVEAEAPEAQEEQEAPPETDAEIARYKKLVEDSQRQTQQLLDILAQQALRPQQAPQQPQPPQPQLSDEAVKLALFGGDERRWNALSPHEQAEAKRLADAHAVRESKYAKDPSQRYSDIRQQVVSEISSHMAPILQDYYNRQAQAVYDSHSKDFDDVDRGRLNEIFNSLPGRNGGFQQQRLAFEHACARVKLEKQQRDLAAQQAEVQARSRQNKANKKARRGSGRKAGGAPKKGAPDINYSPETGDLFRDVYQRLKDGE